MLRDMARRIAGIVTAIGLWSVGALLLVGAAFSLFAADVFFAILGKDATLTGRTKIWSAVMREIQDRPWQGYGYSAVWGDKSGWGPFAWISKDAGFQAHHAHNSWIEQWLGMGILGLAAFILFAADTFFAILGKDATLTGRTKIWAAVMRQIEEQPWLGFGYSAVWGDTSGWGPYAWISKNAGFEAQHAHNSWLEQWLGMGLMGLIAWGLFYLQTMTLAVISVFRDRGGGLLAFPFLVVYSLVSLTESIAVVYNDFRWALFVAFAAKLAFPDRQNEG